YPRRLCLGVVHCNAVDETGNDFDGVVNGAVLTTDRFGNPNSAYYFDGDADYISFGNIIDVSTQSAITISGWFNVENLVNSSIWYTGITFGKKMTGQVTLRITNPTDKLFQAGIADEIQGVGSSSTSDLPANYGEWYHVAGVFQDKNPLLYVNGVLQTPTSTTGTGGVFSDVPSTAELDIGRSFSNGDVQNFYQGKIDDVSIYDYALTNSEIQDLYNEVAATTGIESRSKPNNIVLYPNPSEGIITISSNTVDQNIEEVQIYNSNSQLILVETDIKANSVIVDISSQNTGFYVARIKTALGVQNKRFIITW
ncbi:MAG: T9SS type A sorting domain-containing protein, partial [Bacteroidetes bacterium]|nr:T9SS type A sorting domain-containing protein [Bacteroidota bacterium]